MSGESILEGSRIGYLAPVLVRGGQRRKEGRVAISRSAFQFDPFADGPRPLGSR